MTALWYITAIVLSFYRLKFPKMPRTRFMIIIVSSAFSAAVMFMQNGLCPKMSIWWKNRE